MRDNASGNGQLRQRMSSVYEVECFDWKGDLKWRECVPNLVVNEGLDDVLKAMFKEDTQVATWYVGLVDNAGFTTFAPADTMASHAGWTESEAYTEATRVTLALGSVSSQSVDNSTTKAAFSINDTKTIKGAFVCSDNAKGGTSGALYGEAAFAATRAVESGDTLNVTVTLTSADAG